MTGSCFSRTIESAPLIRVSSRMRRIIVLILATVFFATGSRAEDRATIGWDGFFARDLADYHLFADSNVAGIAAREYWEDMVENDKLEFTCIVGEAALIAWALGEYYAVGSIECNSLEEWLDLWLDTPEEHWASYDGEERECYINESLPDEFDFDWDDDGDDWQLAVFYRC